MRCFATGCGKEVDPGMLEFSGGRFSSAVIAVATKQDYIITSADDSSWTALPQNTFSSLMAAYVTGSTVQMVGCGKALLRSAMAAPCRLDCWRSPVFCRRGRVVAVAHGNRVKCAAVCCAAQHWWYAVDNPRYGKSNKQQQRPGLLFSAMKIQPSIRKPLSALCTKKPV